MTNSDNQNPKDHHVVTDCELDAVPEKVWRALTDPELLSAWLLPTADKPGQGLDLTLDGAAAGLSDKIKYRLIASKPHRLLRFSWREEHLGADADKKRIPDTIVTFFLTETPSGGTRLQIFHRIVSEAADSHRITMSIEAANCNYAPQVRCAA